jgi:hypothetical protein
MAVGTGWHILVSSMLRAVRYDEAARALYVRFSGGGLYRYADVPPEVAEALLDPPEGSHGRYFNDNIRDSFEYDEEPH